MNIEVKICICLTYIGDNGQCPIHGDPNSQARGYVPPRLKKLKQALDYRRATSTMRLDGRDDNTFGQEEAERLAKAVRGG